MKPLLALTLLAVVAAGCGATKVHSTERLSTVTVSSSRESGPRGRVVITVVGRGVTLPNVKTGTLVKCGAGAGATVPARGGEVLGSGDPISKADKNGAGAIRLRHLRNGSIVVACKSSR